jgi:putative NADPH-quinone reductase
MDLPLIRTAEQSNKGDVAKDARRVQDALVWADHIVLVFPLWLDDQPAYLRGLFEQVFRYGFVHENLDNTKKRLKGKTVHTIMTMGVSKWEYLFKSRAYGVRMLETGLWKYAGLKPVRRTLIGSIHTIDEAARKAWLKKLQDDGAAAR